MSTLLVIFSCLILSVSFAKKESFDYQDRTCNSHECFLDIIQAYGDCKLSQNKSLCLGTKCKFIGNSNIKMCVNPIELNEQNDDELTKRIKECSVSVGSQQLCLYDNNNKVYDTLCKRMGGVCVSGSKKCAMDAKQYAKIDKEFEKIRKDHHTLYELPYDYTNDILIVVDGTSTKEEFEADEYDAVKGGVYKLKADARWSNGNWGNHGSNFYEDYRGAKYYWYGPDANEMLNAEKEVKGLVEGVADTVCDFIANHTDDTLININIDLVGYSRGGYTIMEAARKLHRDGCLNKKDINIRFMGLYDPVSSTLGYSNGELHGNAIPGFADHGMFADKNYEYNAGVMPTNVDHIVISYGDPKLGSRAYFNTCDEEQDKDRSDIEREYFLTTHGGIGGTPMDGDFEDVRDLIQGNGWKSGFGFVNWSYRLFMNGVDIVEGYGEEMECQQSMKADLFIRGKANQYGLPIDKTNEDYYDFHSCSKGWKHIKQEI